MAKYIVGVRPSGRLHLGHYASVIKPALKYKADVLLAQYHAPHGNAVKTFNDLIAYVPPQRITLQSENFDGQLYFELLEATPSGLLNHMPQYKVKDKNALMFTYPVLMAHDITSYDYVIVGDDQRPHIEFAKDILTKIGFPCPEPIYEGGRIMDLRHSDNKMSSSEPSSCLFLDDKDYEHKITKAVTDEAGRQNLENIYNLLNEDSKKYRNPPDSNATLKKELIQLYKGKFIK